MKTDWEPYDGSPFVGAKAALICGSRLVVLRRDDIPEIPYPNTIDLPGGGREEGETPVETAAREIHEETALEIAPGRFHYARSYARADLAGWFLAAEISETEAGALRLGDEGQALWMMEIDDFLSDPEAIPQFQARLRDYLGPRE